MARRSTRHRERCPQCHGPLTERHAASAEQRLLLAIFDRPRVCRFCAERECAAILTAQRSPEVAR